MYSTFVIFSILLAIATLVFLCLWRREQDWWLPKISFERLSSIMPFAGIMQDGKTLVCNDGTLAQVFAVCPTCSVRYQPALLHSQIGTPPVSGSRQVGGRSWQRRKK